MTKDEKYSPAAWVIDHALKKGAAQVSVIISNSQSSNITIRDKKIDLLEQAAQNKLLLKLYVNDRYSTHATNRLQKKELIRFIEEAIVATRYLSPDPFRSLPESNLYYGGGDYDLNTTDLNFNNYTPDQKIELASSVEEEISGKDSRILSTSASYTDSIREIVIATSNGFKGDRRDTLFRLSAEVSVKSGDSRPSVYRSESAIHLDKLKKTEIGSSALKDALKRIGQKKIPSGRMEMIIENRILSRIFSPMIRALNGASIQQKRSFLAGRTEEKLFSDKLSVTDDPFINSGRGSKMFDNEGVATKKMLIFDKGVLKNYYIDTYYAKKLKIDPTGGSSTNLVFETGDKDLIQMISQVDKGVFVTGFNGGNCNETTGDFSYGIEGFLIEKGVMVHPVTEMNITGNMMELWKNIVEVGNDPYSNSPWLTPSILFEKIDFSGT